MKKKIVIMIVLILFFTQTPLLISVKENMNTQKAILGQFVNSDNIVEVLSKEGNFKTLIKALHKANLLKVLESDGMVTIFAPTDKAFSKLSKKSLNNILDETNRKELVNILSYHITIEKVMPNSIENLNGKYIIMLNGEKAKITVQNGEIYINDIKCGDRIETKYCIVYPIDTVMIYRK